MRGMQRAVQRFSTPATRQGALRIVACRTTGAVADAA